MGGMTRLQEAPPPGGDRDSSATAVHEATTVSTQDKRKRVDARAALGRSLKGALACGATRSLTGGEYETYRSFVRSQGSAPPAGRRLLQLRRRLNHNGLTRAAEGTRAPRVVLYVRTFHGEDPGPVFSQLREVTARKGWAVTHLHHDQLPFGQNPNVPPDEWPGWVAARDQIKRGFADGVLVPNRHHISSNATAYIQELEYIGYRNGFTWLLASESDP
ncbi:hypothetical protein GCM10017674_76330 [Streptomyces gardneri]|uniref:Uncharacterized protein n=1 Tax=Streptomyces gardneri TaxID=66892 RepID=A0A4Y3RW34_9ACTN|nr:hypothetical protein SGA01_57550 [Streptomyces gardneri]GHH21501.1 hypothetical protein GCM10017674_76330 [Streptomyces gardneri]